MCEVLGWVLWLLWEVIIKMVWDLIVLGVLLC